MASTTALYWRNWLRRAIAGDPYDLQNMYGIVGERDLPERILGHLAGYQGSAPVLRDDNGAVDQYKGDVVMARMVSLRRYATKEYTRTILLAATTLFVGLAISRRPQFAS